MVRPYRTLEEALPHLQVADLVLVRHRRGLLFKTVREISESYWNHLGLVLVPPDKELTYGIVLIVEALDRGIEVHKLQAYASDPERYDIGIKRMAHLTEAERDRIRGFFLDKLDTPYDFTRLFAFVFKRTIARLAGLRGSELIKRHVINIDNFVCSSFAQRAFYMALPPEKREMAFFRDDKDLNFLDQMEAISPGDIAKSRNTEWLYNPHD